MTNTRVSGPGSVAEVAHGELQTGLGVEFYTDRTPGFESFGSIIENAGVKEVTEERSSSEEERKKVIAECKAKFPDVRKAEGVSEDFFSDRSGNMEKVVTINADAMSERDMLAAAVAALHSDDPPVAVYGITCKKKERGRRLAEYEHLKAARGLVNECNSHFSSENYDYNSRWERFPIEHSVFWNYGPGGPAHDKRCNFQEICSWHASHDLAKCGEWILDTRTLINDGFLGQVTGLVEQTNGWGDYYLGYIYYNPSGSYLHVSKIVCNVFGTQNDPGVVCPN